MAGEETQAEKRRAAQEAAFEAWYDRPRDAGREETDRLWLAMWDAADFSWDGLADAGWALGFAASQAQKLKRWRAPADFPGGGDVQGEGETAWKEATLQDYWRWSIGIVEGEPRLLSDDELIAAGLLVEVDGTPWHVLHRPDVAAGEDTAGAALAVALLARLEAAPGYAGPHAPDGRVLMPGARAQGLDAVWRRYSGREDAEFRKTIHVSAQLARFDRFNALALAFGDETRFDDATFGDGAGLNGAAFGDGAGFDGAAFGNGAGFYRATFGDGAGFDGAAFGDRTWFRAAPFSDVPWFNEAAFGDRAWFREATFGDGAGFHWATFGDGAGFDEATFGDGAGFHWATFGDKARFQEAAFGDEAGFNEAAFGDGAEFERATFGDRAEFDKATFGDRARFMSATFGDEAGFNEAAFGDGAWFGGATFGNGAGFNKAAFGDRAWFVGAAFRDRARFDEAAFGDWARFGAAAFGDGAVFDSVRFRGPVAFFGAQEDGKPTFAGSVSFKSARFDGPALFGDNSALPGAVFAGRTSFRAATFADYADFSRCTWPARAEDSQSAFEGARFRDVADFNTDAFDAFALFDGAGFERPIRFADPQSETPEDGFKRAVTATEAAVERDEEALSAAQSDKERERLDRDRPPHERGADARWAALSGGFRTLKLAMEAQSDQDRQQRFYRFELRARLRRPSTPWWERYVAGPLYWASSDYGTSIVSPLMTLLGLIAAFALAYWGIAALAGAGLGPAAPIDFALSQSVRPFGVWWGPAMPDIPPLPGQPDACRAERLAAAPWRVQLAHALGQGGWTVVKALATLQSFLSVILLFLFALAVRRRFQIS